MIFHSKMKKIITVVEDDHDLRNLLAIAVQNAGYEVIAVADGVQFMRDLAQNLDSSLYILDINLGAVNGYEICRALKSADSHKRVILVSANPDLPVYAQQSNADDYLVKPIRLKLLIDKINLLLKD